MCPYQIEMEEPLECLSFIRRVYEGTIDETVGTLAGADVDPVKKAKSATAHLQGISVTHLSTW